jgi:uncharacterized protein YndB with AHSA1/START domain
MVRQLIETTGTPHYRTTTSITKESKMSDNTTATRTEGRDLFLTRVIDAPPDKVYQAWTDKNLLEQWFCPRPWRVSVIQNDLRAGGASLMTMHGPEGEEFPNRGVYLDVVPNKRLVFTDAFTQAWEPSEKAFMVAEVTFEDLGGKTRYSAHVRHWSEQDREAHEKMGFHEGWAKATEQLVALVEAR